VGVEVALASAELRVLHAGDRLHRLAGRQVDDGDMSGGVVVAQVIRGRNLEGDQRQAVYAVNGEGDGRWLVRAQGERLPAELRDEPRPVVTGKPGVSEFWMMPTP
jgi:hypothetical protein